MAAVFAESERSNLHLIAEGSEISAEWIQGVKKGWAKVSKDIKQYEGRIKLSDHPEHGSVIKAMDAAVRALKLLHNYVNRLSDDLLINKGAWTLPSKLGAKEASRTKRWKTKVIEELHIAIKATLKYLGLALGKQEYVRSKKHLADEKLAALLQRTHAYVDKAVDQVGAALKRLFMALGKVQAYYAQSGRKLGGKGFEPKVNRVGPITVVFKDTPEHSPKKLGFESTKTVKHGGRTTKRDLSPGHMLMVDKGQGMPTWRHPKARASYLKTFKEALARLEAKQLGWLAKIKSSVHPPTKHLGAAALYYRDTDSMAVLSRPSRELVRAIIHELGHRYWYKHMTAEDRHNFGRWFGEVKAVTKYGGTNEVEDFAEVFSYYVMDKKLTRDQHDRFRQFMTGKRPRTEAMEEGTATKAQKCRYCDQAAERSLIWADGRAYIPCCRAHERKARNQVASQNDSVCDVKQVEQGPSAYHEAKQPWTGKFWDVGHYAKTLPRFEFILHYVARMTRLKKNRDLVNEMGLKYGKKGWYYTVGGTPASNPTKDAGKVYDMIRRTALNYYVQQAEDLRAEAHESVERPYHEHQFTPHARLAQALRPALDFVEDEQPGQHFGLQAGFDRLNSALQEAPAKPPPRAPTGRRSTPRGATIRTHSGPDIQGVKSGEPIRRSTVGRRSKGTSGPKRRQQLPDREVQEIPDSLLQMLGTDWKTMRAHRVHDNRMTVNIDGVRFSLYTRRG